MNIGMIAWHIAMVTGLASSVVNAQANTQALRDPCSAIRDAASETDSAEQVSITAILTKANGERTRHERRLIGDRDYIRWGDETTWTARPRYTVMPMTPQTRPWNCRRVSGDVLNGTAATVWSYGREFNGERAKVTVWVDNASGRQLRTEVVYRSANAPMRSVMTDFDYGINISRPKAAQGEFRAGGEGNASGSPDLCKPIRDAVTATDSSERVSITTTLVKADGSNEHDESRLIGDRTYEWEEGEWIVHPRYSIMETSPWNMPWKCEFVASDTFNGIPTTVWSYGRDIIGRAAKVTLWVDDRFGRVLHTEVAFISSKAEYRSATNDFDYDDSIGIPEEVRAVP